MGDGRADGPQLAQGSAAEICRMFTGFGWNRSLRVNDRPFHSQADQRVSHWERAPHDPGVEALRRTLRESSGLASLETVDMVEGASAPHVQRAARLFHRDGFVALTGVLAGADLARTASGVAEVTRTIAQLDPQGYGTNGAHRYSFGGCSMTRHMLHHPAWRALLDLPAVTAVLTEVFGSPNYLCRGGGGELALPGAVEYQVLHSDQHDERGGPRPRSAMGDKGGTDSLPLEGPENLWHGSERLNGRGGSFRDPSHGGSGGRTIRDLPCSMIAVNFTLTPQTFENAPIRVVPGSASWNMQDIPGLEQEPDGMRWSTLCPLPAGTAILRDARCWHGGSPNLSDTARAFPNGTFGIRWLTWTRLQH